MDAPVEFSTLYIFTFIINSVDVLSCSVLPSRQWRRHVWHPVSCLFVHFDIHLTYSLYSIKLIQLRPKLNLRFFSICSFLGSSTWNIPHFRVRLGCNFRVFCFFLGARLYFSKYYTMYQAGYRAVLYSWTYDMKPYTFYFAFYIEEFRIKFLRGS